jgi:adenine deaminase
MQLLTVYSGMSNADAIRSMTSLAARTVNGEGRVGEVAEGMQADLLVVRGDPLRDLSVLVDKRNIETVIKAGQVVEFDDGKELEVRHSHPERVYTYSETAITYQSIYGDGPPVGETPILWEPDDARQLARDLKRRELDARAVVDA